MKKLGFGITALIISSCFLTLFLAACTKDKSNHITPELPAPLQPAPYESSKEPDIVWADYIKENADELFKAKIEKYINIANYYNGGHYDFSIITDEQKIALGLEDNCAEETETIAKESVENTIAEYFVFLPKEYISIAVPYMEALYKDGNYSIIRRPFIGAVCYEIDIKNITVKTIDSYYSIECTADLLFFHATGVDCIGESIITLSLENNNYQILAYSQKIYDEPIVIE